jgi:hypothetical protein
MSLRERTRPGLGVSPQFLVHLLILLTLCFLALTRGRLTRKTWIIVFPTIALFFDLVPLLNFSQNLFGWVSKSAILSYFLFRKFLARRRDNLLRSQTKRILMV